MARRIMTCVLDGRDGLSVPDAGGKARSLAVAAHAGLPVPAWFVVRSAARTSRTADPALARTDADVSGEVEHDLELANEIADAMQRLAPSNGRVAVRSSAVDEDGIRHSFAGQFDSFLNVPLSDVPGKVAAVQRSAVNSRVLRYRRERALSASALCPAVIVQRMVDARVAGVAFSADPVSGRRGIAVINAVRGFGTALVGGEANADLWHVDRRGEIVDRRIAEQRTMHTADHAAGMGMVTAPVPQDEARNPSLTDGEIRAVADLARGAARVFGRPQDIEWAYEGDRLWLLQSRPITSLDRQADPDAPLCIWDNSNIVESYSGATTPLTFSFASDVYEHVYRQFCRLLRVPETAVEQHDDAFRNMLGFIRGRLYYNLLNWYRVLALLPGYTLNRAFMEQMMGVKEALPADLSRDIAAASVSGRSRARDACRLLRTVAGLAAAHVTIERRIRAFERRLDAALAPPSIPLDQMRPDELAGYYRMLRRRLLLAWDAPLVNDFFAMIFYGLLRRACAAWADDREGTLQNDLLGGEGGMASAEPALRIRELAQIARGNPTLSATLATGTVHEVRAAGDTAPGFPAALTAYLDKFGDRTVNELKLESTTLHDDPLPLFRSIGALARQSDRWSPEDAEAAGHRLRIRARQRVRAALRRRPLRRLIFGWILRNARARVRDRENLRLERTRLFGRVRRIFIETGRRLHALDALDDPSDIFFLQVDEVLAFVEGRGVTTNLRGLVAVRREEHAACHRLPSPDARFETRGIVYQGHELRRALAAEAPSGEERRGTGCSPGVVRGVVTVVADPRLVNLDRRSILVAEHTDPGWVMAFPSALAVLVERGSLLSHAAIVARELGIPAVVAIPGLTAWLKDGDIVELDGAAGTVRRIATAEKSEAAHVQ